MSSITLARIRHSLDKKFKGKVDISDLEGRPPEDVDNNFYSRSLGALAIQSLAGLSEEESASSVVDGYNDEGLDAIGIDRISDKLFLVQGKWRSGKGAGVTPEEAAKFLRGVGKILSLDFSGFNAKIKRKEGEIKEFLMSSGDIKLYLITIHTATQPTPTQSLKIINDYVDELNDAGPIAEYIDISQKDVYKLITSNSKKSSISLPVVLYDWGLTGGAAASFYGQVDAVQIMHWWKEFRNDLFSENLRHFHQSSAVNVAIKATASQSPDEFWYFNNGITVIADKVTRGIAGSQNRKLGNFTCEGASVVNGAQTVGSIGSALEALAGEIDYDNYSARVHVRLISLEGREAAFTRKITRYTNLQNAVGTREFAALDPKQQQLAIDFSLDGLRYSFKRGEAEPSGSVGCSIVEATQALGCMHSIQTAVQVKREISAIWANIDAAPYSDLFTENLSSTRVWNAVLIMRMVEELLHKRIKGERGEGEAIAVHLNRVILHYVFASRDVRAAIDLTNGAKDAQGAIQTVTMDAFDRLLEYFTQNKRSHYMGSFGKNGKKCAALIDWLNGSEGTEDNQLSLF
tara:strand:- start:194 stop:1915 length:1722 start_codon:yes stop_codon:yes gene_type:complete